MSKLWTLALLQLPLSAAAFAGEPYTLSHQIEEAQTEKGAPRSFANEVKISLQIDNGKFLGLTATGDIYGLRSLRDGDMYRLRVELGDEVYTTKQLVFDQSAAGHLTVIGKGMPERVLTEQYELLSIDKDYGRFYDRQGRAVRYVSCGGGTVFSIGGFRCDISGLGYMEAFSSGWGAVTVFAGNTPVDDALWHGNIGKTCFGTWWSAVLYSGFTAECGTPERELFSAKKWGFGVGGGHLIMTPKYY